MNSGGGPATAAACFFGSAMQASASARARPELLPFGYIFAEF
jgi:hypothetical protein